MPPRGFVIKLTAIAFLTLLPLWVTLALKWPIYTDFLFYSTILKTFSAQFWAGELYPRWLMNTNGGFGSPVFLFYAPFGYYIMSAFEWLSPIDPHGFGRLIIGLTLGLFIAGMTSYRWFKCHMPEKQAQTGAFLYASFPSLIYICYHGFSFAQVWAVAWAPFVLKTAHDVTIGKKNALPVFAAAYAILTFIHPLSVIAFGAIPCLYILVFSPPAKRLRTTFLAAIFAFLGVASAAITLVPAIANKAYIASEYYTDRFGYAGSLFGTFTLLPALGITLTLAGLYFELPKTKRALNTHLRFWLAILVGMIALTSPLAKPLWDHVVLLQYLQGAWRLVPLMAPAVIFIAASWEPHVKSRIIFPFLSVTTLGVASLYSANVFFYETDRPAADILKYNLISAPEYKTRWMSAENLDFQIHLPESYERMDAISFVNGTGHASIISQKPRRIHLHVDVASENATIAIKRLYFPGWVADDPHIAVQESHALLAVHVPSGSHDIELTLPWFDGEKTGLIISLSALCILTGLTIATRKSLGATAL